MKTAVILNEHNIVINKILIKEGISASNFNAIEVDDSIEIGYKKEGAKWIPPVVEIETNASPNNTNEIKTSVTEEEIDEILKGLYDDEE
jgi:hypothetical protein